MIEVVDGAPVEGIRIRSFSSGEDEQKTKKKKEEKEGKEQREKKKEKERCWWEGYEKSYNMRAARWPNLA